MGKLLKRERRAQAWYLWLASFLARALLFLSHYFNKAENEVLLERKKKVEDEKPFKDVPGTENDVSRSTVSLQDSSVCDVMLMDQGRIRLCHLNAVFRI